MRHAKILALILVITIVSAIYTPSASAHQDDWKLFKNQAPSYEGRGFGHTISWMLSIPINALAMGILGLADKFGLYSIRELIFAEGKLAYTGGNVFSREEWENVILPWYRIFFLIASAGVLYQLVVVWVGYRTLAASISPQKATNITNALWNIILAILFMTQMPLFLNLISNANAAVVGVIKDALISRGLYNNITTLDTHAIASTFTATLDSKNPLLDSLILLGLAGFTLTINFLYMVRKFVVGIMIIISPIVAWSLLSPSRTPFLLMLSEIVSNTFMSTSHAIVLAFFLSIMAFNGDGMFATWWAKLFALYLLIPTSALLRRLITGWLNLIGIDEERYAGLAMLGFGTLASTTAVITGTLFGSKNSKGIKDIKDFIGGGSGGERTGREATTISPPAMPRTNAGVPSGFNESLLPQKSITGSISGNDGSLQKQKTGDSFGRTSSTIPEYPTGIPLPRERSTETRGQIYNVPEPELLAKENLIDKYESKYPHELPVTEEKCYDHNINIPGETGIADNPQYIMGPAGSDVPSYKERVGRRETEGQREEADVSLPVLEGTDWKQRAAQNAMRAAGKAIVFTGAALGSAAGLAFAMGTGDGRMAYMLSRSWGEAGARGVVAVGKGMGYVLGKGKEMAAQRHKGGIDGPSLKSF